MREFQVIFFEKDDGTEPAKDFIKSQDTKMMAKLLRTVAMLQENGTHLREPYSKFLEDGIFELRAKVGTNISRVLYFFIIDGKIILTNGFVKKQDKTPKKEIDRAKKYRAEYIRRKETVE